jgi:hypothetical protein
MGIHLPRIEGTGCDLALNEFIDSINSERDAQQPKLAAHAAAAVVRFLAVNHKVEAGTRWLQHAMPLVNHINVYDHMVDKLYDELVKRVMPDDVYKTSVGAAQHLRLGCLWGIVALIGWLLFYFFVLR